MAAALAFASAAVTLYWTLGGTAGLDTVGGPFEKLARDRSAASIGLGAMVVVAKLVAAALALALLWGPARLLARTAMVGGALLALYGAVLVGAGALVLTGIIDPSAPVDEYGLRWHVLFWDLWFVLWASRWGSAAGTPSAPGPRDEAEQSRSPIVRACAGRVPDTLGG